MSSQLDDDVAEFVQQHEAQLSRSEIRQIEVDAEEEEELEQAQRAIGATRIGKYYYVRGRRGNSIWYMDFIMVGDEQHESPAYVGTNIEVLARTNEDNANWGLKLRVYTPHGRDHYNDITLPSSSLLLKKGEEAIARLMHAGFIPSSVAKYRAHIIGFLLSEKPEAIIKCVSKIGWHGEAFVLPDVSFGTGADELVLQTNGNVVSAHGAKGTLAQWNATVGDYCQGNSRLVFAVSAALAVTMMRPAKLEGGTIHFRGPSSCGKTTTLHVVASVAGGSDKRSYVSTWRSTDNALEDIALQHNDMPLVLDEIGQVKSGAAGAAAYMLANGQGKSRSSGSGDLRDAKLWTTQVFSSGEVSLADKICEDDKSREVTAGQEVRFTDITAIPLGGAGVFENTHGMSGEAFSKMLVNASKAQYGTLIRAWLKHNAGPNLNNSITKYLKDTDRLLATMVERSWDGQVKRVAFRFAFFAVIGEAAIAAKLVNWPVGEAINAAKACFSSWLEGRGTTGSKEDENAVKRVRTYLRANMFTRFVQITGVRGAPFNPDQRVGHSVAGYKRISLGATHFYVTKEVFQNEICAGMDHKRVLQILEAEGLVKFNEGGRSDFKMWIDALAKYVRCVYILPHVLGEEEIPEPHTTST